MSIRIALRHRIEQRFNRPTSLSTHWLRLRPAPHAKGIEAYSLKVDADPNFLNWARDPYENHIARLDLPEPISKLGFDLEIIADLKPANPFDFLVEPYASQYPFEYPEALRKELAPYLRVEQPGPKFKAWIESLERKPSYIAEYIGEINRQLNEALPAAKGDALERVDIEALLKRGSGSAWELAWLLTLSLRSMGLAARFTSGYRIFFSPEETGLDDVVLHAWSEVFLPGAGWIGLDPSFGLFTAEGYIPLASAPTPISTLPVIGDGKHRREIRTEVLELRRLNPKPVAWPYEDAVSADLRALGGLIDENLKAQDIRLAIGMGLSFVAEGLGGFPEWTIAALGPSKRPMAEELLMRLWPKLAPGGFLQVGQGEWFVGEPLPRWRLNCFARADGKPIWLNPDLLSLTRQARAANAADAKAFAETLANKLGLASSHIIAAHEDGLYGLWNRQVPFNPPSLEDLKDPDKRLALAKSLSISGGEPTGWVLPLHWDPAKDRWASGTWTFRRGSLYLTPGASALGFRLPLDSLPAGDEAKPETVPERCQFDDRPVLPDVCGELSARFTTLGPTSHALDEADGDWQPSRPPRTALCVEARDGRLHVFLPPLTHLEHYLDLIAVVEAAATELCMPVVLEGYEPPEDCRLRKLSLEPEAGILKLLLPSANSFGQQWEWLQTAYGEAARLGLRSERIGSDGRPAPPGGRMELVMGGETPADSPFLRRPALLRSLIEYWQRHPSLSYFFAGRYIGPGGPAPRPDEGRDDALYELAIALERMPAAEHPYPWISDRLLRHLLADPAGNIRQAEIRIDALYPPDRSALRLGRAVLRSFESPPDARMAALQSLLAMGLLGFFGKTPQRKQPLDFGPALHDRFMLPQLLWDDLEAVIQDLNDSGYPFQMEWFKPFFDLNFPSLGTVQLGDMGIELRTAHEPWPLLAEEGTAAGMARFIDVANQRVEAKCTGLTPGRYVLVCNGHRVPSQPTGVQGETIGGVRYKASNPPSTLHPTKPPVASLVFDLIDTWTGRVVGGCTYWPPRPEILGFAGIPEGPQEMREGGMEEWRRIPPAPVPIWGSKGQFLPTGSGLSHLLPPPESNDPRNPYLLDLSRRT